MLCASQGGYVLRGLLCSNMPLFSPSSTLFHASLPPPNPSPLPSLHLDDKVLDEHSKQNGQYDKAEEQKGCEALISKRPTPLGLGIVGACDSGWLSQREGRAEAELTPELSTIQAPATSTHTQATHATHCGVMPCV